MLTKIKDISKVGTGTTPSMKNKEFYESNDIPFIKPSDLLDEGVTILSKTEYYISFKTKQKARLFPKNTILCACIGSIGKIGITSELSSCNQQINYLIPNEEHDPMFIAYSLLSKKQELINMGSNSPVVPIINKSQFEEVQIIVYNIEQEIEIRKELDSIQYLIDIKTKQIEELDNLIKSRFIELFGTLENTPFKKVTLVTY